MSDSSITDVGSIPKQLEMFNEVMFLKSVNSINQKMFFKQHLFSLTGEIRKVSTPLLFCQKSLQTGYNKNIKVICHHVQNLYAVDVHNFLSIC